jgi:hypothetical protein
MPSEKRSHPSSTSTKPITAAELRVAVARDGRPLYLVAAEAKIHPSTAGRMLAGSLEIRQDIAARILQVARDPDAAS